MKEKSKYLEILDAGTMTERYVDLFFVIEIFYFNPQNGTRPLFETWSDKDLDIMSQDLRTCIFLFFHQVPWGAYVKQ